MEIKKTKWYQYANENAHKFSIWFVFLFVTAILVNLAVKIIASIPHDKPSAPSIKEVKIYFPKNESDTLHEVVTDKLMEMLETIDSMHRDSTQCQFRK